MTGGRGIAVAVLIAGFGLCGCGGTETESAGGESETTRTISSDPAAGDRIPPTTPAGLTGVAVSPTQVNLNWLEARDNVGVTGYRIYRGGVLLTTVGSVPNVQDTGLAPSTTYSYTVQAIDEPGNASGHSPALIVTTPGTLDATAPSTPTGLAANAVTNSRINVSWTASTDNVGIAGYRVFRNGTFLLALGNVTTYQDTFLLPGTTYLYTLRAFDSAGNISGLSTAASATTLTTPDTIAPTVPTNFGALAISPTQVNLSWSASTDNDAVAGYRVYRNGAFLAARATTSYQDSGLTASTMYSYNVDAIDATGNVSALSAPATVTTPAVADTIAPSAPTGLSASAVSGSRIDLSWNESTDNVDVTGYRVFRNGAFLVDVGDVTTYQDMGLAAVTTYSYAIRAFDAAGNVSAPSTAAGATTLPAADSVAPTTPTNLAATAISDSAISLSWTASIDNVGVVGYRVYRNDVFLGAVGNVTTALNSGLAPATTYSYRLDAFDAVGNASGLSTSAVATTQAAPPPPAGTPAIGGVVGVFSQGGSITITGSSFGSNADGGPMLWDNFDAGSNGAVIANSSTGTVPPIRRGPLAGYTWQRDGGGNYEDKSIVFSNSGAKASSTSHARAAFTDGSFWGLDLYIPYAQFTTGKELYISFYHRMVKTGATFPRQTKAWIAYTSSWNDKAYWSTGYNNCQEGGYRTHISELDEEHWFSLQGDASEGEWVRFDTYLKQSGPNVPNGTWRQNVYRSSLATPGRESFDHLNQVLRTSVDDWVRWTFGGAYYSMSCGPTGTGIIDIDDFYMDDTQARVEVCASPTWAARTKCELQVPTAWSDTSITATFNKGYLSSGNPAYVYVIDATGNVNANGFAIVLP